MTFTKSFDWSLLKDLKLHTGRNKDGSILYYLSAVYEYANERGVYEVTIPKIKLDVRSYPVIREMDEYSGICLRQSFFVDIGFGELPLIYSDLEPVYTERLIKNKTKKMTLSEIEKALGYSIEIVSKKED